MKTIREINVSNKRVLVRCDFNVPQDQEGNISDDFRIRQSLQTIKYLMDSGSKIILMSHLGEPGGQVVENLKLDKIKGRLSELLGIEVKGSPDCAGEQAKKESANLKPGEILLLQNLRFYKGETENDEKFAQKLSENGEIYVNDAFGVCHRAHASVSAIAKFLPSFAGLLLEKEISALDRILQNPEKPMVAVIGGKKVETKTKVIDKLSEKADFVIVSGLIKKEAQEKNIIFRFPEKIIGPESDLAALDINQNAVNLFKEKILSSKTVLWNGPFGKFEDENYKSGTLEIAKAIIQSNAFSVVGGGETVEFLSREGIISKFSHVSTGGGAMLSYLAGETLPGIAALEK